MEHLKSLYQNNYPDSLKRIIKTGIVAAHALLLVASTDTAFAQDTPPPETPPTIPPSELLIKPTPLHEVTSLSIGDPRPINDIEMRKRYLVTYNQELVGLKNRPDIIASFQEIHNMSAEDILSSLDIYFPAYSFVEQATGISRYMMAVIHGNETRFSMDVDPGRSGYVGAMQRAREFYSDAEVEDAAAGYDFLNIDTQRYKDPLFTARSTDYKEIKWAGRHIEYLALSRYPELPFSQAVEQVVLHNYSADGSPRVRLYRQIMDQLGSKPPR